MKQVAVEWGPSVGGGIAREGNRRMRKQRGKHRWTKGEKRNKDMERHIQRTKHVVVSEKAQDPNPGEY